MSHQNEFKTATKNKLPVNRIRSIQWIQETQMASQLLPRFGEKPRAYLDLDYYFKFSMLGTQMEICKCSRYVVRLVCSGHLTLHSIRVEVQLEDTLW